MYEEQLKTCNGLIAGEFLYNAAQEGLVGTETYETVGAILGLLKLGMVEVVYDDRVGAVTIKTKEGEVPDGIF